MPIYDIHSHWGMERDYALRGKAREKQKLVFGSEPRVGTEAGMAEDFRLTDMKVILDLGSSSSSAADRTIIARPTAILCCSPPDMSPAS